jgi:hypothetical protein
MRDANKQIETAFKNGETPKMMFTIENQATGKVFRTDGDGAILDDALIHGLNFPYGVWTSALPSLTKPS